MKLLVSRELLRQIFGLESPIQSVSLTLDPDILAFWIGSDETPTSWLRGTAFSHFCDDQEWVRWQYEVIGETA